MALDLHFVADAAQVVGAAVQVKDDLGPGVVARLPVVVVGPHLDPLGADRAARLAPLPPRPADAVQQVGPQLLLHRPAARATKTAGMSTPSARTHGGGAATMPVMACKSSTVLWQPRVKTLRSRVRDSCQTISSRDWRTSSSAAAFLEDTFLRSCFELSKRARISSFFAERQQGDLLERAQSSLCRERSVWSPVSDQSPFCGTHSSSIAIMIWMLAVDIDKDVGVFGTSYQTQFSIE